MSLPKLTIKARKKIAYDSNDHIFPWGTKRDNSKNPRFNNQLINLFQQRSAQSCIKVLDIGCAGGGFVKSIIEDGHFSVGIEGSDFSKKNSRAEWRTIPRNLFTCDVTQEFSIRNNGRKILFDVITCWEVLEHIPPNKLNAVLKNIKKNMAEGGLLICSIPNWPEIKNGVILHHIVKPKNWWLIRITMAGFICLPKYVKYFQTQFVRGKWQTRKNFHIIATNNKNFMPTLPVKRISVRETMRTLGNYWAGSSSQKILKFLVMGE